MYKKKKNKKKITIISIVLVLIILLCITFLVERKYNYIENFFKTIVYPINKLEVPVNSNYDQTKSITNLTTENEELKEEIEVLKKQLDLKNTLTEYEIENATVLSRNKDYWFNTISIDKGKKDGIKKGNAVITYNGLIGKISKVYNYSSEVKLLTSDDVNFKVSVSINVKGKDAYAILNGYDKKKRALIINGIDNNINTEKGTTIKTSGLGGVFPSGLYVGEIIGEEKDSYNLSKKVFVKTKQDFDNIHYVTVLKGKK